MRYGLPYQGSKSRIAEWVVSALPPSHTLVDLFAGGCAVTHAALLSGRYEHIIANDITDSVMVFCAAINGEFDGYAYCPSREEWQECRERDTATALLYSFGNGKTTYLWGAELEAVKRPASLMVTAPSVWERYEWYHRFCEALKNYLASNDCTPQLMSDGHGKGARELENMERLVGLERVSRLHGLHGLQGLQGLHSLKGLHGLQGYRSDYRAVHIPEGATVYADPPYRSTPGSESYGFFDFNAFDAWLGGVDFPVYVSEFDAPPGCVEVAAITRTTSMAANTTDKVIEKLFVQERFADRYEPAQGVLNFD